MVTLITDILERIILSIIERLSSFRGKMYCHYNYRLVYRKVSFIQRCPLSEVFRCDMQSTFVSVSLSLDIVLLAIKTALCSHPLSVGFWTVSPPVPRLLAVDQPALWLPRW